MVHQKGLEVEGKKAAGYKAAEFIKDGMTVGLGTGTTVFYFIEALSRKDVKFSVLPTSTSSLDLARKYRFPLLDPSTQTTLDIAVDGADEIDSEKRMIKGGGGALLREKIVAFMAKEMVVIVDSSKVVKNLGKFPLPVEILPFGLDATIAHIRKLGYAGKLRDFTTDNGNKIFDIQLPRPTAEPLTDHLKLKGIPGVVETGFFFDLAGRTIVGYPDGRTEIV
jgi:ribose 5-phosphate isomerase A